MWNRENTEELSSLVNNMKFPKLQIKHFENQVFGVSFMTSFSV